MKFIQVVATALLATVAQVQAVSKFKPARPPAAPLAVRSPYLNVWLNGRTDGEPSGYLPGQWPKYWTENVQGWQGYVMVDGTAYNWMGGQPGAPLVDQLSMEYTSTSTTFTFSVADKVELTAKFLSPIYPDDLRRQSVTSSYLEVIVKSMDGQNHRVQVYCDVSGEWASGDDGAVIKWQQSDIDDVFYHKFARQDQDVFNEIADQASWGNWYWSTEMKRGITYQVGEDRVVRKQFTAHGKLTNQIDNEFRAIRDRWPVFAFSADIGTINTSPVSTLFTIGYAQNESILFQSKGDAAQHAPSLWASYFKEEDMVSFFYKDYKHAVDYCYQLDRKVSSDSIKVGGQDYATITSLALRQAFGGLQYTGTPDNVKVFLKEISSNSDIQTVDVIFPTFPVMLYLDPELIRYTLAPLLENQKNGNYPNNYAMHDLGRFPRALGYPDGNDEPMPLEECGNMIIMMLAYVQRTKNIDYLKEHWDLLSKWAGYLVEDSKIPANQLSTDDFAGHLPNQTNLAIKGIIALEGMSKIAKLTDHGSEAWNYSTIANNYLNFWEKHGVSKDAYPAHTNLQYDAGESYGLLYNIYADKVLGLHFIPDRIYEMQSNFYQTVSSKYGVVLDTRGTLTKVDWEMFAAAMSSGDTQKMFISKIAKWINETPTHRAFTDLYDVNDGGYPRGIEFTARPVVGGVFALLAL